jgi:hypothetical protein
MVAVSASGMTSPASIRSVVALPAPLRIMCRLNSGNRQL